MPTTLNRRERKAAQLLAHYATCEKLAIALGMPSSKADGRKISIALWKLEQSGQRMALALCNDSSYTYEKADMITDLIKYRIGLLLGKIPPGFFVNRDPRGYALKIDPENKLGALLIADAGLQTDWGGYGILSPEINGD